MATDIELALFEQELRDVSGLPIANRWNLERDETVPLGIFVTMHPAKKPEDIYKARIRWTDYFQAPSVKFINLVSGAENDHTAWPKCHGFRPTSLDACIPWTAEGHALHPDWKNSLVNRFPKVELPMHFVLQQLQVTMDTTYDGRSGN